MADISKPQSPRVFAILARDAPVGVIFRRGPSKQVLLIKWNLEDDSFEPGQWFKGRIYERRCDLSPSGRRLIYFAADYKEPYFSWTAVGRPPYLTALALWEKGDCWGGGGLFEKESSILLNHASGFRPVPKESKLPRWMKVRPLGAHAGAGEDHPIYHLRLIRDGWALVQEGRTTMNKHGSKVWIEIDPPEIYTKPFHFADGATVHLRMCLHGINERDGSWYILEYELKERETGQAVSLGRIDWADWDRNGDLLFAREGRVFRLKYDPAVPRDRLRVDPAAAKEVADFQALAFEERAAPAESLHW